MIDFGKDFFNWFHFIVKVIQLFIGIFGNDEEKAENDRNRIID